MNIQVHILRFHHCRHCLTGIIPTSLLMACLYTSPVTATNNDVQLLGQNNFTYYLNNSNPLINGTFQLVDDIELGNVTWVPVGTLNNPTMLTFDGNGHIISGLNVTTDGDSTPTGLFGYLVDSWIHSLSLKSPHVLSSGNGSPAGAVVGEMERSNVTDNISYLGQVSTEGDWLSRPFSYSSAGGLVGWMKDFSRVENNLNTGAVSTNGGYVDAGGVVGYASSNSTTTGNLNTGAVSTNGSYADAGGAVGQASRSTTTGNLNTGAVSTNGRYADAGGVVGQAPRSTTTGNLNTGAVSTNGSYADAGGAVGHASRSTTTGNLNTGAVSTNGSVADAGGAVGSAYYFSTTTGNLNTGAVSTNGSFADAGGAVGSAYYFSTTTGNLNTGAVSTNGSYADAGGAVGSAYYFSTTTGNLNTGAVSTNGSYADAGGAVGQATRSTTTGNLNTGAVSTNGSFADAGGAVGRAYSYSTTTGNLNTGAVSTNGRDADAGGAVGRAYSYSTTTGNLNTGAVSTNGRDADAGGAVGYASRSTTTGNLNTGAVNGSSTNNNGVIDYFSKAQIQKGIHPLNTRLWDDGTNRQYPMLVNINPAYQDLRRIKGTQNGKNAFPEALNEFAAPGGSVNASLFDRMIWNVKEGYLPFLKGVARARAEAVGIYCDKGGFACNDYPPCLKLFPFLAYSEKVIVDTDLVDASGSLLEPVQFGLTYDNGEQEYRMEAAFGDYSGDDTKYVTVPVKVAVNQNASYLLAGLLLPLPDWSPYPKHYQIIITPQESCSGAANSQTGIRIAGRAYSLTTDEVASETLHPEGYFIQQKAQVNGAPDTEAILLAVTPQATLELATETSAIDNQNPVYSCNEIAAQLVEGAFDGTVTHPPELDVPLQQSVMAMNVVDIQCLRDEQGSFQLIADAEIPIQYDSGSMTAAMPAQHTIKAMLTAYYQPADGGVTWYGLQVGLGESESSGNNTEPVLVPTTSIVLKQQLTH